jgi:uncharacterized OsmC-like protein
VRGEVETEGHVLVIRRIHVTYHVRAAREAAATVERVHGVHAKSCPIYLSLYKAIEITTEFLLEEE